MTYQNTVDDYHILYDACIVGVKGRYGITPKRVYDITTGVEGYEFVLAELSENSSKYPIQINSPDLELSWPELGFIDVGKDSVYLSKKNNPPSPARYRRGLHPSKLNCVNSSTFSNALARAQSSDTLVLFDLFLALYNPKHFDPKSAIERHSEGGRKGTRLSHHIRLKSLDNLVLVEYLNKTIAYVNKAGQICLPKELDYFKEIFWELGLPVNIQQFEIEEGNDLEQLEDENIPVNMKSNPILEESGLSPDVFFETVHAEVPIEPVNTPNVSLPNSNNPEVS